MKTRIKIILWTLPLLVIVLEIVIYQVVASGLATPWKFVGKPFEKISGIIGFNPGKLFVTTGSGEMVSLATKTYTGNSIQFPAVWSTDRSYNKELDPINLHVFETTRFTSPPPPFEVKQIVQFSYPAVESSSFTKFALSQDGN